MFLPLKYLISLGSRLEIGLSIMKWHISASPVRPHQLAFFQNVAFHRFEQIGLGYAGIQFQFGIQGIELEEIAVRAAGGTGAAIADLAKIIDPLFCSVG